MHLVNLSLQSNNDAMIFTYKLTQKCCNFLFHVDSVQQNIPKSSLKYTKEHLYNLERYLGILTLIQIYSDGAFFSPGADANKMR